MKYLLILLLLVSIGGCSKNIEKDNPYTNQKTDFHKADPREYMREGLISDDLYRVVIVEPKGMSNISIKSIKRKAKKRALISLQKYLITLGGTINQNNNAGLLNIIDEYGTLREAPPDRKTRFVYLFEIKKNGLKQSLASLRSAR